MNSDPSTDLPAVKGAGVASPEPTSAEPINTKPEVPTASAVESRGVLWVLGMVAVVALLASGLLWQKLSNVQEQLERQSGESTAKSVEARAMAKESQDLARETAARVSVFEARLSEVSLQRSQLEELMQSLSRSRDENLVVDIESAIRLAQQQAQLTGSVEPLLAALQSADQRVIRAAQPRLTPLQRAIARDIDRIKSATVSDTPGLLVKLDELVRLADELSLANDVATANSIDSSKLPSTGPLPTWWQRGLQVVRDEARGLVRVSRIAQPEAALLSPEQSFFLRENLKLKLLNARLGLLARQLESSRADLVAASLSLTRYFDPASRKTQAMAVLLQQVQSQLKTLQLPRVDETLAALTTAAAGR
jgi:uroporphyrin-3 C-methyltransferase